MHAADLADVDPRLELLNFLLDNGSDLVGFEFHGHSCRSSADGDFAVGWRSSRRRRCRRCGARRRRSGSGSTSVFEDRLAAELGPQAMRDAWLASAGSSGVGGGQPHADAVPQLVVQARASGGGSPAGSRAGRAGPRPSESSATSGDTRPPSTRSSIADFSSGETRAEARTASSLGKRSSTSAITRVELLERPPPFGRPSRPRRSKRLGVDVGNVLDAHVGLDAGPRCGRLRR